eukprot:CAMPEP_0185595522 /NCGR_PEP_ID=MMETSP0434-20130131/78746_1 /TAXON_ID=626734 ORGANISM="Favella taraikaensis, Strain Fe Narragansett Bay" /NCGR_SAMPLE_ID=MMETSP0434 /ASSEMBLY_ACC=CAM_ASM_000379 /LENGTH=75 /DNA_ID=CAMNT_0028223593 /DNA_START=282 /DNA_END=509 /DNA_ORIENTATION=-
MSSRFEADSSAATRMKRLNAHASDASTADMNTRDAAEGIKFVNGQLDGSMPVSDFAIGAANQPKKDGIEDLVYPG